MTCRVVFFKCLRDLKFASDLRKTQQISFLQNGEDKAPQSYKKLRLHFSRHTNRGLA